MSDDSLEKVRPTGTPKNTESSATPTPAVGSTKARPVFGRLNQDLKDALNSWDCLTEEMSAKVSPEEEQLREVKRLLSELKSKLNEFED